MKIPSNINFKTLCDGLYLTLDEKIKEHIFLFLETFFATILNNTMETYILISSENTRIILPFLLWLNKNGFSTKLELIYGDKSGSLDNIINSTDTCIKIYISWS